MPASFQPPERLGPIALSLSGGGFRAAAFHLGTMDTLSCLGLLPDLVCLSTVSGGTFTGVRYALALKEGKSFREFFSEFKNDLSSVRLMDLALEKLTCGVLPSIPSGRWDLITAFAEVYHEKLFNGQRFDALWQAPVGSLPDLIFNSTEFRTAVGFRFRKCDNPKASIGNGNIELTEEQVRQIRLADIVAASSCFPGGFEPLKFPDDFSWPDGDTGRKALAELQAKDWAPLPLMDGGVYDNQGMSSLLLKGSRPLSDIGLFIISDTDRVSEPFFAFPESRPTGWIRLWHLAKFSWLLLGLCAISAVASFLNLKSPCYQWPQVLGFGPLLLSVAVAWVVLWLRWKIKSAARSLPSLGFNYWAYLKKISVNDFINMVELRISSLFSLSSEIFMRRIRRLIYNEMMGDPAYAGRILPNIIYDIGEQYQPPQGYEWLKPSDCMIKVAQSAKQMPTTLWFTQPNQLNDLIAAGRMTVCFKLLLHILSKADQTGTLPPGLGKNFEEAKKLFFKFKQDPYTDPASVGPT